MSSLTADAVRANDTFLLAVAAMAYDGELIAADPTGEESDNVAALTTVAAEELGVDVDELYDWMAGWLMGIERRDDCVRCGADYSPVCPSCAIDAGCSIG